jgi:hypothetical protein
MPNEGFLELGLFDVSGKPATDSDTRVRFSRQRDNTAIGQFSRLAFPPTRRFQLPAFPQENNLLCTITPKRWRERTSGFFTLTDGETITRNLNLLRKPEEWQPKFDLWNNLPLHFMPLKAAIQRSPALKVRGGKSLGVFADGNYDGVSLDDGKTTFAKAGLLNLYTKLTNMKEPISDNAPWFSFVEQILEIAQSRMIAIVRPEMGQLVQTIRQKIGDFPDYELAIAGNHFGNMPPQFGVKKSSLFSVKSSDSKGNLQVTCGQGKDENGNDVLILDTDIDESGDLLNHLLDVFKHKITKKQTHPYDIHEYLSLAYPAFPQGYELV